jgi:hypothetical protein
MKISELFLENYFVFANLFFRVHLDNAKFLGSQTKQIPFESYHQV